MSNTTRRFLMGAAGAAGGKNYIDDVFSTYLYEGTAANGRVVTNNIDMAGEGAMLWVKRRDGGNNNILVDSERGPEKYLYSNSAVAETDGSSRIQSFSSSGFVCGDSSATNGGPGDDYVSWTFRKQKGFFDIVKYNGDGSTSNQIPHSLGSVPACILIKCFSNSGTEWMVYHKGTNPAANPLGSLPTDPANYRLLLDQSVVAAADTGAFNNTEPTATHFTVGDAGNVNNSSRSYIAYLFAGGEANNNSVHFNGTDDYLNTLHSSDYDFGTGDFTIEAWVRYEGSNTASTNDTIIDTRNGNDAGNADAGWIFILRTNGKIGFHHSSIGWQESTTVLSTNTWYHVAITRNGNDFRVFINGTEEADNSHSGSVDAGDHNVRIGYKVPYSASSLVYWNGKISNLRIVKGTAVYTSSFTPPTAPLTSLSGTSILCCNGVTATSNTVTQLPITMSSNPVSSSVTPFTMTGDTFSFGEDEDQSVIKCASYTGSGVAGLEVNIGWEPQFVLLKRTNVASSWKMHDSMRGVATGGNDASFEPDNSDAETDSVDRIDFTSRGFILPSTNAHYNNNGDNYIFISIRFPDGYVGKPAEAGTDVFTTVASNSGSSPGFTSGFPVDFYFYRKPTASSGWQADWSTYARLIAKKSLWTNKPDTQGIDNSATFAFSNGVQDYNGFDTSYNSWMWKRGQGMDVVAYTGIGDGSNSGPNATSNTLSHSLGRIPEMIWVKCRSTGYDWYVYHSGQNGGTNPQNYYLRLNHTDAEQESVSPYSNAVWNNTAPTSTTFSLGPINDVNDWGQTYIAMLFASVDGISKCGVYDGQNSTKSIFTGFQPRFAIIKKISGGTGSWYVFDTVRGWGAGDDQDIKLNMTNAQSSYDVGAPTATGFDITTDGSWNGAGGKYIYYAHA